jgi:hypothetical protein
MYANATERRKAPNHFPLSAPNPYPMRAMATTSTVSFHVMKGMTMRRLRI